MIPFATGVAFTRDRWRRGALAGWWLAAELEPGRPITFEKVTAGMNALQLARRARCLCGLLEQDAHGVWLPPARSLDEALEHLDLAGVVNLGSVLPEEPPASRLLGGKALARLRASCLRVWQRSPGACPRCNRTFPASGVPLHRCRRVRRGRAAGDRTRNPRRP